MLGVIYLAVGVVIGVLSYLGQEPGQIPITPGKFLVCTFFWPVIIILMFIRACRT